LLKSVQKTFNVLEILCNQGETGVSEIARRLAVGRSTAHRLLATLIDLGYVEKTAKTNRYVPTLKMFEIGVATINRTKLQSVSRPFLVMLSTDFKETINLGIIDKGEVVYIDKIESPQSLRMDIKIGSRVPAFCTALGKAMLAYSDESEMKEFIQAQKIPAHTNRTATSITSFKDSLLKIRKQGYAIDEEEFIEGVRCIAAPIKNYTGRVVAALSISGPSIRMTYEKLAQLKDPLINATWEISKKLGNTNSD
jgi:IclR family KDG regulon transcriptional repressor